MRYLDSAHRPVPLTATCSRSCSLCAPTLSRSVHLPPSGLHRSSSGGGAPSGYINASHIRLQPGPDAAPGDGSNGGNSGGSSGGGASTAAAASAAAASYIATQGPLPHTAEHFWRMVLAARAPCVVMLTNCVEKGAVKCAQYFPPGGPGDRAAYGDVAVSVVAKTRLSRDCERRVLRLRDRRAGGGGQPQQQQGGSNSGGGQHQQQQGLDQGEHELVHLHYVTWPDHGVPEDSATLRLMCREVQRLAAGSGGGGDAAAAAVLANGSSGGGGGGAKAAGAAAAATPVLHCSAGIGRTGTFIAVDVLLRRIDAWFRAGGPTKDEVEAALDVPLLVHSLRQQRGGMVQTLEQYAFLYRAALDELEARQAPAPLAQPHPQRPAR